MKKSFILIVFLLGIACEGFSQPQFTPPSFPNSVNLFDKFEISFTLNNFYSNPYDPSVIRAFAVFTSPNNEIDTVEAFYYKNYILSNNNGLEQVTYSPKYDGWRIRFAPQCVGLWRFNIHAIDANGSAYIPIPEQNYYTFTCNSVNNADGFISKANSRFLKREVVRNGQRQFKSYFPIGPNVAWYDCYPYTDYTQPIGIYYYKRFIIIKDILILYRGMPTICVYSLIGTNSFRYMALNMHHLLDKVLL